MQFFKDIAKKLNVFLTRFQTNNLMLLFLSDALVEMFTSIMSMVIKLTVLNDETTALKLVEIEEEAQRYVIAIIVKLQERSPLQYTVLRMASLLSPWKLEQKSKREIFDLLQSPCREGSEIKMDNSRRS